MSNILDMIRRYAGQVIAYIGFAVLLGYFSAAPDWSYFPDDKALIKLSLTHGGQRKEACREHTKEERAKLPPTAKPPKICPRERHPVRVSIWLDDKQIYDALETPMGITRDGPSQFYKRFQVAPGKRLLKVEIEDSGGNLPPVAQSREIELTARGVLVIEADHGKLKIR